MALVNPHDPGADLAGERGEAHAIAARAPLAIDGADRKSVV